MPSHEATYLFIFFFHLLLSLPSCPEEVFNAPIFAIAGRIQSRCCLSLCSFHTQYYDAIVDVSSREARLSALITSS